MQRNWTPYPARPLCPWNFLDVVSQNFGNRYNRWSEKQRSHFHLISPRWRDKALSLWSGSTDSKNLDYQRTNPREYQIVRTHTKETTWIQDLNHPTTSSILCRMPHLNSKQNRNTNPIISRQDYHLTQPCLAERKKKNSPQISLIWSFHKALDQP